MDQLFNGGGSVAYQSNNGSDPLLSEFQLTCSTNCGPGNAGTGKPYADSFGWISHTYDTPYLDVGCATQNYIEAELNENSSWANKTLGLPETTDPSNALGFEDPQVFVPGNHSGFADLVPGNPATVDPPIVDTDLTTSSTTGGTLAAGTYEYAIADQFTNSSTAGLSQADVTPPVDIATGTTNSISISWQSICHAADYVIYRGYSSAQNATTGFTWTQLPAAAGSTAGEDGTVSPLLSDVAGQQLRRPDLDDGRHRRRRGRAEVHGHRGCGHRRFGTPDHRECGRVALGAEPVLHSGAPGRGHHRGRRRRVEAVPRSFHRRVRLRSLLHRSRVPGGRDVPRGHGAGGATPPDQHLLQRLDRLPGLNEYQSIYGAGGTDPDTAVCPTGTCTWSNVVDQVVGQMFQYMMNNDPRPSYVHQTNIMGSPPAGVGGDERSSAVDLRAAAQRGVRRAGGYR